MLLSLAQPLARPLGLPVGLRGDEAITAGAPSEPLIWRASSTAVLASSTSRLASGK